MQMAKDTALVTWAERLRTVNPARKVSVDGVERPALLACENERPELRATAGVFWVSWGKVGAAGPGTQGLHAMACEITYASSGTEQMHGCDRGRELTRMDAELRALLHPATVAKVDYSQEPPVEAHTSITWSGPQFAEAEQDGAVLRRTARLALYFYPEEEA